jgi:hypothetical protein
MKLYEKTGGDFRQHFGLLSKVCTGKIEHYPLNRTVNKFFLLKNNKMHLKFNRHLCYKNKGF